MSTDEPGRFLFVVPPLTGHINPTLAVGGELLRQGHHVAWTGYSEVLADLLPAGRQLYPIGNDLPASTADSIRVRSARLRGAAALKFLWEDFLHPLAEHMVPGIDATVDAFKPDVIIVDQQTYAGALVAERRGIRWVTSSTTSAELIDPFAGLPKIRSWADDILVGFQERHGLGHDNPADRLRYSPDLTLAFTTRALVGADLRTANRIEFVGPALSERPDATPFPWHELNRHGDRPAVLVSLGTVNAEAGAKFFRAALEGLADENLTVVMSAPPELVGEVPDNAIVASRVPQLALLERMDVVVSHGGHNTVCETLAHGIPIVVAPIRDDQPIVADQVVQADAGVRIRFARPTPATIRDSVLTALSDSRLRAGAARIAESFAAAGGAPAAAQHLIDLLRDTDPVGAPSLERPPACQTS